MIALYLVFNVLYTKFFKEIIIVDVFCIAGFFLLRIYAGIFASDSIISYWIILMTAFLALFLGFNKRREEIRLLRHKAAYHRTVLSRYNVYFIDQMIAIITSSIVVVYMFYCVDTWTVHKFGSTHLIISIPFVYYGIFRYLYMVHRLKKEGDPTRILLYDRPMQVNILLWLAVCIAVIYCGL